MLCLNVAATRGADLAARDHHVTIRYMMTLQEVTMM